MGGVDLMDSMIGRYRIIMRSKKWYMKIFYHLVDMSIVNAWMLYKKVTKKPMKLAQFREQLAVELCQTEMEIKKKGRKTKESLEKQMLEELEKKGHQLQLFHQPKYVWMDINTEYNLRKFDAYVNYQNVNFNHSLSVLNAMFFYVVIKKEIASIYFIIPN